MITAVNNVYDIIKSMRFELIAQSGLDSKLVLNSLSVRGTDLKKYVSDDIFTSYSLSDNVILFEITPTQTSNDCSFKDDDACSIYVSYNFGLSIYGNSSDTLANIIKLRFESESVRLNLYRQGIYVDDISSVTALNEFINDTMWLRSDLTITISCKLSSTDEDSNYLEINSMSLYNA